MTNRTYRAEVVGSLLRPPWLLDARHQYQEGSLPVDQFKQIEDRAVDEAIALQERCGLDVITDGEMRRLMFASQLAEACDGFGTVAENYVDWFDAEGKAHRVNAPYAVTGKIRRRRQLSAEELVYLRARARAPMKITLPSPTMYAYNWCPGVSEAAYPTPQAYLEEVAGVLRDEVVELVRLGARYIQFDAPEFGMLLNPYQQEWFGKKGFEALKLIDTGIDMMNGIMVGMGGVQFALHICRGNRESWHMASGSYDFLAKRVFARTTAQVLLLEYDDERSGDFAPLAEVGPDAIVVLGLITTKTARPESMADLQSRIHEASRYVPTDRLAISTQCGFASVSKGNAISEQVQEAKLRLVAEVARRVWS